MVIWFIPRHLCTHCSVIPSPPPSLNNSDFSFRCFFQIADQPDAAVKLGATVLSLFLCVCVCVCICWYSELVLFFVGFSRGFCPHGGFFPLVFSLGGVGLTSLNKLVDYYWPTSSFCTVVGSVTDARMCTCVDSRRAYCVRFLFSFLVLVVLLYTLLCCQLFVVLIKTWVACTAGLITHLIC